MVEQNIAPKKGFGYFGIMALIINAMTGTGWFFGAALGAHYSGNASLIAWAILGVVTIYITLCFGELVSLFPNAGGVYEFGKRSYGHFMSFVVGWITWLDGTLTASLIIVAAVEYLFAGYAVLIKIGLALCVLAVLHYVAYRGTETSTALLIAFAVATMGMILLIIIPGLFTLQPSNFTPFFPPDFTWLAIGITLFFIVETFFGWEAATFLGEETPHAEKVIPRTMLWSTIVLTFLVMVLIFTVLGNIPFSELAKTQTPLNDLGKLLFGNIGPSFVGFMVFISLIGSAAGGIIATPRLVLALARDKLFIEQLAAIHPQRQTPYKAIIFQLIVSAFVILIGFGNYEILLSLLVPTAILMYISVFMAVPILRRKYPDKPRYFKTPFATAGPILLSIMFLGIVGIWLFQEHHALQLFKMILALIFFGVPIYFLLMAYFDPAFYVKVNNILAYFSRWFEWLLVPQRIRQEIIAHLGGIEGKRILEFGCTVGTLTLELADRVGSQGSVYATDLSKKNIEITHKRTQKKALHQVHTFHDEHQMNQVHPSIPRVDAIVSFGMIGYLQDLRKVLHEMAERLPEKGKICLVDYVDLFKILPNVSWLVHPEEVQRIFAECGFSVSVKKIKGMFWNYLFIYGIKSKEAVPYV